MLNVSKKNLIVVAVVAVALLASAASAVVEIRVSQESSAGAGDFSSHVLGTINAREYSTGTAADYYAYSATDFSFHGPWPTPLVDDRTHVFFVNASDGLSLFVVHDNLGTDGGSAAMKFVLSGDTGDPGWKVQDDHQGADGIDDYDITGDVFTASLGWGSPRTDGFAIGSLDGDAWSMLSEFTAAPTGITSLAAYSDGGSTIGLNMATGRRVKYEIVPEPATMSLLGIGGLLALVRRRRK